MAGEYRKPEVLEKLPESIATPIREGKIRIALTSQPMAGVSRRPDLVASMAAAYKNAGQMKYATGLSNGSMVPVEVHQGSDRYWAPGELFFRS